jgi:hypothetical protein
MYEDDYGYGPDDEDFHRHHSPNIIGTSDVERLGFLLDRLDDLDPDLVSHLPTIIQDRLSAYDFTAEVISAILAEPRRLNMTGWARVVVVMPDPDTQPACGTVVCVGGMINLLGRQPVLDGAGALSFLLGAYRDNERWLLMRYELNTTFKSKPAPHMPGTVEYAEWALRPFKDWRERWRAELEAIMLVRNPQTGRFYLLKEEDI